LTAHFDVVVVDSQDREHTAADVPRVVVVEDIAAEEACLDLGVGDLSVHFAAAADSVAEGIDFLFLAGLGVGYLTVHFDAVVGRSPGQGHMTAVGRIGWVAAGSVPLAHAPVEEDLKVRFAFVDNWWVDQAEHTFVVPLAAAVFVVGVEGTDWAFLGHADPAVGAGWMVHSVMELDKSRFVVEGTADAVERLLVLVAVGAASSLRGKRVLNN